MTSCESDVAMLCMQTHLLNAIDLRTLHRDTTCVSTTSLVHTATLDFTYNVNSPIIMYTKSFMRP